MRGGKDMRVESHNQKFNNGCTKDSTKRVDVHIFYGFYTGTGSVQYGYLVSEYLTDAHVSPSRRGRKVKRRQLKLPNEVIEKWPPATFALTETRKLLVGESRKQAGSSPAHLLPERPAALLLGRPTFDIQAPIVNMAAI